MTLLCVPILVQDAASALDDARAAKDAGADIVEFRVDQLFAGTGEENEQRRIAQLVARSPLPAIVTCRAQAEGGNYDGDDDVRLALYEFLGTGGNLSQPTPALPARRASTPPPRYLDLELATYERSANLRQKVHLAVDWPTKKRGDAPSLILSIHDFNARPADLTRRIARAAEVEAADVVKVAYRARSLRDNLELLDLIGQAGKPTIALGMGEFGLMSRVLAPKFAGFLTFASLRPSSATAPGQPTMKELLDRYRFRSIGPRTKVYGVVGWPVGHSLSPLVHNAGFEAVGHDGVYLPLPVAADDEDVEASFASFKATMLALIEHPKLDFAGCSVTAPHKVYLFMLARSQGWQMDENVRTIAGANTLVVTRDSGGPPQCRILNTDTSALVQSLLERTGDLGGAVVAVLGAGGAAGAAAYGLLRAGARVLICNRTMENATLLADCYRHAHPAANIDVVRVSEVSSAGVSAVVNCTPVGMVGGPEPEGIPLPTSVLSGLPKSTVVMDTVYNPERTPLIVAAEEAGLRTVTGIGMFVHQAAAQFKAWTGVEPPPGLFERLVRERMGS